MLSAAITLMCTLSGALAVAVVAHCLIAARDTWAQLMREGEVLRAAAALQASAREMGLRPAGVRASGRVVAMRRPAALRPLPLQACAA